MRGKYSDGHPKIMLSAKFATGYKDMEAGMLKDGRVVPPKDAPADLEMEPLGKYKAFFLVTADRDGVGSRGQNKGFINGKFFAIDPGHSLEGNGKYLDVSDDLSFKDTYGRSTKPRFKNFSVSMMTLALPSSLAYWICVRKQRQAYSKNCLMSTLRRSVPRRMGWRQRRWNSGKR